VTSHLTIPATEILLLERQENGKKKDERFIIQIFFSINFPTRLGEGLYKQ
jgi:hypothetical protein